MEMELELELFRSGGIEIIEVKKEKKKGSI